MSPGQELCKGAHALPGGFYAAPTAAAGTTGTNHAPSRVDSVPEGSKARTFTKPVLLTPASRPRATNGEERDSRGASPLQVETRPALGARPGPGAPRPLPDLRPDRSVDPRAAPRAPGRSPGLGASRDPHPDAEEAAAAARLGCSAETWPRERRGGARRADGLRPPGNSLCALLPFRKRERPPLANIRPRAGAAPAAGPG